MRVLRIIDRLNVGGPALQTTVLSRGLDPSRFEQRILSGAIDAHEGDYVGLRAPDLPVQWVNGLGRSPKLRHDAQAFAEIVRAVRDFRPDIVHTHKAKAGVLGRLAAWVAGTPATVHHFHGHLLHGYFPPAVTWGIVATERVLAHRTTRLVSVGARVRDELLSAHIGKPEQYRVVAPGMTVALPPAAGDARAALGIPRDSLVVGFVGRLAPVKRPERFVDLALALYERIPDVAFLVAGEGELLGSLRERAQPLGERMRFLGWRGDVETVYGACDVVALTSENEGMPISLIEAAGCGVPTVTTRVGSADEVVLDGVTGLVTGSATAELATATERLLLDPQLRSAMGSAARTHFDLHFSAERFLGDMAELYEEVAAQAGRR